jgi:hypothetical protein
MVIAGICESASAGRGDAAAHVVGTVVLELRNAVV